MTATARGRAPGAGSGTNPYVRAAVRGAWEHLPVLLVGSAAVAGSAALAGLAGRATAVAGLVAALMLVVPSFAALVSCCLEIVDGRDVTVRDYGRAVPALAGRALRAAAVPALLWLLTLVALAAHERGGGWLTVPLGAGVAGSVVATAGLLVLLPLRARHRDPEGTRGWLLALHVLARRPVPFLAAASCAACGAWAATTWSNGLFLLVPAPFALVLAAAYRTSPAEDLYARA